ncbi:MAG: phosphoadenosine phosphosulfate reductase family protein [Methanomicrobiales archaeon]|nr:phosphoadenosine phosphosulfate reductase family protein [Methanomicrobiales archaeon]
MLGKRCACGAPTRAVALTPPADPRPAFVADLELVNDLYMEQFGVRLIPEGHLALLNKVPDTDRMEEVVAGGAVIASIRYLTGEERWELLPRPEAFSLSKPARGFVVADEGAADAIREGASLLAPGVVEMDEGIEAGDEVFILSTRQECIGVGRARVSGRDAARMQKGLVVRTRRNVPGLIVQGCSSWEEAVRANARILEREETRAIEFIQRVADESQLTPTVAYSGGKDSLATLLLVMKALGKVPLIFADTGMEFGETYRNIDTVAERYGLEVERARAERDLADHLEDEGPPSMKNRWCCRLCKLEPVEKLIKERWSRCLSFIGQRRFESWTRRRSARVWSNPRVPSQLSAAPIQDWTSLQVWLYLFREKAPYNELYGMGYDRIGCYVCPSSDLALFERIGRTHPELWQRWRALLEGWRIVHRLPEGWVSEGDWRKGW